jgi:hypothetical protein
VVRDAFGPDHPPPPLLKLERAPLILSGLPYCRGVWFPNGRFAVSMSGTSMSGRGRRTAARRRGP